MAINTTGGVTAPTTTNTPVVPAPKPQISEGTKSKAVAHLERALKAAGYDVGKPDQKFDARTTKAVKLFQAAWGLPVTGALDDATKKKIEQTTSRMKAHKNTVGVGQRGKDVFAAEQRLRKLGYDVKADGVYDKQTAEAVKAFKADEQLKNKSGTLGENAAKELRESAGGLDHAAYRGRVTKDIKEHKRLDALTKKEAAKGISEGSSKRAIQNVQGHLRSAGFDPGVADGKFDDRTQAMVERFQRKAGLEPTGTVDAKTWAKLEKSRFYAKNGTSPAQRMGEKSAAVLRSEKMLKKLGYNVGKVDGIFDRKTQAASRKFERRIAHTGDDGKIGERQLTRMKQVVAAKEHPGKGPMLKKGFKGEPVRILQRRLEKMGFKTGGVDGDFGPKTQAAVKRFQKTFGLKADGKVTDNDWRMLAVKSHGKVRKPGAVGGLPSGGTGSVGKRLAAAGYRAAMAIGGYNSQGLCATGVSNAIASALGIRVYGNGNQIDNNLPRSRFKQVNISLEQALRIPGCVLTWEKTSTSAGSIYGHTAITAGDGHTTYSDFIERYTTGSGRYGLKIFVPR